MLVYNYDPITKEYTGYCEASLDPEESKIQGKDIYLIPAYATTAKPPKTKANEVCIYDNGWQIKADYRGKYIVNDEMNPYIYDEIGNLPEGYIPITENQANKIKEDSLYYVISDGKLIRNPNYDEQKATIRQADFEKAFFYTSLGYVRRSVTMADGSHKDFLSDLLSVISMGIQGGQSVQIITYDKPPFDKDITDWTPYQHHVAATVQFIQECFLQLNNDFLPINEE